MAATAAMSFQTPCAPQSNIDEGRQQLDVARFNLDCRQNLMNCKVRTWGSCHGAPFQWFRPHELQGARTLCHGAP